MSEILVEITRGNVVESMHRGDIAITDKEGNLLYYAGNPQKYTYMRSANKPVQALEVIYSGAYDRFKFTDSELSIMCASHYGEPYHVATIKSILNKIGLSVDNLKCGASTSLSNQYSLELARNNISNSSYFNDCSGKHSGFLSVCVHNNYDLNNYLDPNHPLQVKIKNNVAEFCNFPINKIETGIDGCSAPVFALNLENMAIAYAKLANPENLSIETRKAAEIIFKAMTNAPEMLSGTNGFCTKLIKSTNGRMIGKLGAEGVYCVGIKNQNIGITVKIEDGNTRALDIVIISILNQLNLLTESEKQILNNEFEIKNDVGTTVGSMKTIFKLIKN